MDHHNSRPVLDGFDTTFGKVRQQNRVKITLP
jgi:hypothetical protein